MARKMYPYDVCGAKHQWFKQVRVKYEGQVKVAQSSEPLPPTFNEQACQDLLAELIKHEHLTRLGIKLKVWNTNQSTASYTKREIHISKRGLMVRNYYYGKYLVIHEFAHIVNAHKNGMHRVSSHGKEFQRIEDRLLKLFGLTVKRARVYVPTVYYEGKEVWQEVK